MLDITVLKLILLFLLGSIPLAVGLLPIKVMTYLASRRQADPNHASSRTPAAVISIISCVAGGIILGVSFLELLPEARAGLNEMAERNPYFADSSLVEMLVGGGFLLLYFLEEFITLLAGNKHHHNDHLECNIPSTTSSAGSTKPPITPMGGGGVATLETPPATATTYESMAQRHSLPIPTPTTPRCSTAVSSDDLTMAVEGEGSEEERRKAVIGAFTFILAMLVHTSLEGFAFGIQKDSLGLTSLFLGIIFHKALVFFSVGTSLVHALPNKTRLVVALMCLLASFTPIGGISGILVEASAKGTVSTLLMSLSIGTFIYIAFFEILAPERSKPNLSQFTKLLQWLGCASGFGLMMLAIALSSHTHGKGHGHGDAHSHGGAMPLARPFQ